MAATYADLQIDQCADFDIELGLESLADFAAGEPIDISEYEIYGQIRKSYASTAYAPFEFDLTDAATGKIRAKLAAAQTTMMKAGRYVYDIFARNTVSGLTQKLLEGMAEVSPAVTVLPPPTE